MTGQTVRDGHGNFYGYYTCPHRSISNRHDPATRCHVRQIPQRKVESWAWKMIMRLAKQPERLEQEVKFRSKAREAEQELSRQALAELEQEVARINRQKNELLDLYLNRDRTAGGLRQEEYDAKARQLDAALGEVEARRAEAFKQSRSEIPSHAEIGQAKRLLEVVRRAGPKATFAEKCELLRLLDIHIPYDGNKLELAGAIPTQELTLDELKRITPPDLWVERTTPVDDSSFRLRQSSP